MDMLPVEIEMVEKRRIKLASVFREKKDQLLGFIKKRVRDIEEAEDILQDVFYKLVDVYDTIESVDSWIYAVARNKITDHYRKRKTESENKTKQDQEEDSSDLAQILPDISTMPDRLYLHEVIWETLNEALEELPVDQKEAFILYEFENYSVKEIAAQQEVSVNTVLSRKRYAVQYLRAKLKKFYNELND